MSNEVIKHDVKLGVWNTISNGYIIESLADKFDFVILDLEHGFRDFSDCESQIRFLLGSKAELFVRLRSAHDIWLQALLDIGVTRFLVPQIRSLQEVEIFVSKVRFPPNGTRGFHPKSDNLSRQSNSSSNLESNNSIQVFPIIETASALEILQDIVGVEGVSGTYFGSYDLSIEISNRDRGSIKIQEALRELIRVTNYHSKQLICLSENPETELQLVRTGVSLVVRGIDSQFIEDAFNLGISRYEY